MYIIEGEITYNPRSFWKKAANRIDGDFKVTEQKIKGGNYPYDLYHLRINKVYDNANIEVHSTYSQSPGKFQEFYLSKLEIITEIESRDEFYLYIWRKDFLDRLFDFNKPQTGFKDFDKVMGYKTNRFRDIYNFFAIDEVRSLLIDDKYIGFNVQYEHGKIKIQTGHVADNEEELLSEINKHMIFLKGLMKFGLV